MIINIVIVVVVLLAAVVFCGGTDTGAMLLASLPLAIMCLCFMRLPASARSNRVKRALIHLYLAGGLSGATTLLILRTSPTSLSEIFIVFIFLFVLSLFITFCIRLLKKITGINLFVLLDPFAQFEENSQ